jgi:hypothetical protein
MDERREGGKEGRREGGKTHLKGERPFISNKNDERLPSRCSYLRRVKVEIQRTQMRHNFSGFSCLRALCISQNCEEMEALPTG